MALSRISLLTRILKLTGKLPLNIAQALGGFLGLMGWWLRTKSRRVTEINLAIAYPDLPSDERRHLARKSMKQTGRTIMEIPLMWEWPVERCLDLVKEVEGEELLTQCRENGRGLILLAPHLGNWELAGLYFSSRYKMAALYSPPHLPEFEDYMIRVRGRLGSELVRGDRRGLARLITLLREGGVAGILPDQSPRGRTNAYAPFFGMEVRTMTLVAKLLQKSGAAVLLTYAERLPNAKGFKVVIRECEPGMADTDPVVAATALNASVEQAARAIPEQYQWEYKRMRHRPPGQANPYKPGHTC